MKRTLALLSLLITAALAACGNGDSGTPDGGGTSPSCLEAEQHSDFAWLNDNIFTRSCANFTSCHDSAAPAGNLDMTAEASYTNLVNVPSTYFTDWMRVAPGSCEESYLMVRLRCHSDTSANGMPCFTGPLDGGQLMPPNSSPICQQKVDAICRWIAAGASETSVDAGAAVPDAGP